MASNLAAWRWGLDFLRDSTHRDATRNFQPLTCPRDRGRTFEVGNRQLYRIPDGTDAIFFLQELVKKLRGDLILLLGGKIWRQCHIFPSRTGQKTARRFDTAPRRF